MSVYEDYDTRSGSYDTTRRPVGSEIILGCSTRTGRALRELTVLDAGCGTGNYTAAILPHVGRVEAVDLNPGMLAVAERKLASAIDAGRATVAQAGIDALPLDDASVDVVMVNQVLHHLPLKPEAGWPVLQRVFGEFARVLRADGVCVLNVCSQAQLHDGFWYYALIPAAAETLRRRYPSLDTLSRLLAGAGLAETGRFVPVDAVLQGDAYFDPSGPLEPSWRAGDSTWSLADDDELAAALARVEELETAGALAGFFAEHDARRPQVGQTTFLAAQRRGR